MSILQDKVAVISGGTSGIGARTAALTVCSTMPVFRRSAAGSPILTSVLLMPRWRSISAGALRG